MRICISAATGSSTRTILAILPAWVGSWLVICSIVGSIAAAFAGDGLMTKVLTRTPAASAHRCMRIK
jgi:hypothetical protein